MGLVPPVTVVLVGYRPVDECFLAGVARITVSKKSLGEALASTRGSECRRWLLEVLGRGHTSVLEHAVYTFEATCSRVCSHQLVRHRLASYTQQSMRYTEAFLRRAALEACRLLGRDCPDRPRGRGGYAVLAEALRRAAAELGGWVLAEAMSHGFSFNPLWPQWLIEAAARSYARSLAEYYWLLSRGAPPEDARMVVPMAARTRIVFTMNARELLESFLPLRMCTRAQWEIRLLAWTVREQLRRVHPTLYAYAGPRCLQAENRARKTPCTLEDLAEQRCKPRIEACPEKVEAQNIPACIKAAKHHYTTVKERSKKKKEGQTDRFWAHPHHNDDK